jgi:hypothetical protein
MSKGWSAFCCLQNFGTFVFNFQLYLVFAIYLAVGSNSKIVANIGRGYFCKNKILWVYCSIVKSPEHIFIHFFSHVDIVRSRADYVSDKKAMEKRLSSMNTLLTKTCAQALYFG